MLSCLFTLGTRLWYSSSVVNVNHFKLQALSSTVLHFPFRKFLKDLNNPSADMELPKESHNGYFFKCWLRPKYALILIYFLVFETTRRLEFMD